MNFGQNLYQWFLSNAQSLVLMSIVVIGIYLGFKREFSKLIGFLVVVFLVLMMNTMHLLLETRLLTAIMQVRFPVRSMLEESQVSSMVENQIMPAQR